MSSLIHAGGCLPWLRSLADDSVDHAITDPPYDEHVHANVERQAKKGERAKSPGSTTVRADLGFASLDPRTQRYVSRELARVVKRWTLVFCHVEIVHSWRDALERAGLRYVRTLIWHKPNAAPQMSGDRPAANYETIVLAHRPCRMRWNAGGHGSVYTHHVVTGAKSRGRRIHLTEKPLPLLLELVEDFTKPGELVIDPFAGSGSTGVACLRLGRRFAGAERDAAMAAKANARLELDPIALDLRDRERGQLSLLERAS